MNSVVALSAVETGSFSIREWCAFRKYSIATFYKLRRNGIAPKVTQPSTLRIIKIGLPEGGL
jgi:hypothetical protein